MMFVLDNNFLLSDQKKKKIKLKIMIPTFMRERGSNNDIL